MSKELLIGSSPLRTQSDKISGEYTFIDGEEYYKIANYDKMRPFFLSLVSHSDHWMFISTTGGLTGGRKNEQFALFPYYTDDRLRDEAELTGSKTIFRVEASDSQQLWEPFSIRFDGAYLVTRNLYKNRAGNKIIFEEINHDLHLTYRYAWTFSDTYGFVKESTLINHLEERRSIEILDGIQNLMPSGVMPSLQVNASNLVNAYKKNELDEGSGLGMYMLSAIIVDKAEPSEALKATTVWSAGLRRQTVLLSSLQLNQFRRGAEVSAEVDIRAERGAYFIVEKMVLDSSERKEWLFVAEVNQNHAKVIGLIDNLTNETALLGSLRNDLNQGTEKLMELVAMADGLQLTQDKLSVGRHYSNVLFNIMRGGIFDEGYQVDKRDFLNYVRVMNSTVFTDFSSFFDQLESEFAYHSLLAKAASSGNTDLIRLCYEYLPLTFSRRHGDPSRPWNKFNISIRDDNGNKQRWYEGNWRDIFQNWEALAVSYPHFTLSMITKFVNASTVDGYNPYRITREGIDWEEIEPDNPWSYIGYWGDHQIIYLLKLLEIAQAHQSDDLQRMLSARQFVYANVPYRIKGYSDIASNPQDTIEYSHKVEAEIKHRVAAIGADGKLVSKDDEILKANLTEKLLVSYLAKLTNYVPEGGIWLNTQRPEWNDANNALVGNGVSMVTLYYMRRFAALMIDIFAHTDEDIDVNFSVGTLFKNVSEVFESSKSLLAQSISDVDRKGIIDKLGKIGENYRSVAYKGFLSTTVQLSPDVIKSFFQTILEHIDHSIRANRRVDGLYHAYNLLTLNETSAQIDHLYEMLEGQVGVLSSGLLSLEESLQVLDALKASKIYREDQYSYMLYPDRTLPRFLEKNNIPLEFAKNSALANALISDGDKSLINKDTKGNYHFNGDFNNASSLRAALDKLKLTKHQVLVEKEYQEYLQVFEVMFNHKAFTGRSGTFYGYEGLGSIYWHMVSKLLLAVQETIHREWSAHQGTVLMGRMIDHYYEIRAGIGINKSPELYGSFPTDPYSHTPGGRGVQQPGMTGQVKEDVLNRWAELGVKVEDGLIHFDPIFLSKGEFLTTADTFEYFALSGVKKSLPLAAGQLAFTYCQVPVVYQLSEKKGISVHSKSTVREYDGLTLSKEDSSILFGRTNEIDRITVWVRV